MIDDRHVDVAATVAAAEEAGAEVAIPVLRKYIAKIRATRPYFDANPDSSDEAVAAELRRHAVFRLVPHGVR